MNHTSRLKYNTPSRYTRLLLPNPEALTFAVTNGDIAISQRFDTIRSQQLPTLKPPTNNFTEDDLIALAFHWATTPELCHHDRTFYLHHTSDHGSNYYSYHHHCDVLTQPCWGEAIRATPDLSTTVDRYYRYLEECLDREINYHSNQPE